MSKKIRVEAETSELLVTTNMDKGQLRFLPVVGRRCPCCGGFMAIEADKRLVCLNCGLRPLPADFRTLPYKPEVTENLIRG